MAVMAQVVFGRFAWFTAHSSPIIGRQLFCLLLLLLCNINASSKTPLSTEVVLSFPTVVPSTLGANSSAGDGMIEAAEGDKAGGDQSISAAKDVCVSRSFSYQ